MTTRAIYIYIYLFKENESKMIITIPIIEGRKSYHLNTLIRDAMRIIRWSFKVIIYLSFSFDFPKTCDKYENVTIYNNSFDIFCFQI